MHGHTGATMSMGNGSICRRSWKQKMVSRSSTKNEAIAVYDVLPQVIWMKKFLEEQGVKVKETVLYQDNMSSICRRSWKQKMVSRRSTKNEAIAVYDVLPQVIWMKKFLEEQGVKVKETVLYQDNMSSIHLEKKGKQSSSMGTKHVDIRYFYVMEHNTSKIKHFQCNIAHRGNVG